MTERYVDAAVLSVHTQNKLERRREHHSHVEQIRREAEQHNMKVEQDVVNSTPCSIIQIEDLS